MTQKELPQVEPTGEVVARVNQVLNPSGCLEGVCRIAIGQPPEEQRDTNTEYIVVLEAEDVLDQGARLGTVGVERSEQPSEGHLLISVEAETLVEHPELLGFACQTAMEKAGVETVTVNPERDTNVAPEVLKLAGATALEEPGSFQMLLAA